MTAENSETIEATWDKLAKTFDNWNGMRPRWSWVKTGLSERAGSQRVRVLEGDAQAKAYFALTKDLRLPELKYLHTRAVVNLEQAQVAARIATLLNLTIFIGAMMIFNQLFPGVFAKEITTIVQSENNALVLAALITAVCFFLMVITVLCFSHGGTAQARDLKHLLELSLARRALHPNQGDLGNDTGVSSDLRSNYLSDI